MRWPRAESEGKGGRETRRPTRAMHSVPLTHGLQLCVVRDRHRGHRLGMRTTRIGAAAEESISHHAPNIPGRGQSQHLPGMSMERPLGVAESLKLWLT
jgi:hypothetical protein